MMMPRTRRCACRAAILGAALLVLLVAPPSGGRLAAQSAGGDRPLLESWQETLRYGIDTEVLAAIQAIEEAGERTLDGSIAALLAGYSSRDLRVAILEYFSRVEYRGAEETALRLLEETEDQALTVSLIRYLQTIRSTAVLPLLGPLVNRTEGGIARAAIQALGRIGGEEEVELLLKRFDDPEYPADHKADLILALGELRRPTAVDRLIRIAGSPDEDKTRRTYAADALGKIGDPRAVPVLKSLFAADDALLRAYAATALGQFDLEEARQLLIQGLRDPNVRVRIAAAKGLANPRAGEAVDTLKYKAARDPEPQMRTQAIQSLGAIGNGEALEFLKKALLDEKEPLPARSAVLDSLVGKDPGPVLDTLRALVDQQWESANPRLLEYASQKLSRLKEPRLRDLFLRFLESKNYLLRIHGIRGLATIEAREQRGRIEGLSRGDPHPAVRRTAELILNRL